MEFLRDKHIEYIKSLDHKKDELEYWFSEHLRLAGLYWGLTALDMMGAVEALPRDGVIAFVNSCKHSNGGYGAAPHHDPHVMYTLYAVQILFIVDAMDQIDIATTTSYITSLQQPGGEVWGDEYGEVDSRFVYTAVQALRLLGTLDKFNCDAAVDFIVRSQNFDGGFGLIPGAESHAAQAFTGLGTLSILNRLDVLTADKREMAEWWLAERQVPSGGLNGRPEKLPDVCYSWWVLSSLAMLGKLDYIDGEKLRQFILSAQDAETGGIADREGDQVDVFHTIFGIAGLSLLGYEGLDAVDPSFCLPVKRLNRLSNYKS